jgi:hypothetical protein
MDINKAMGISGWKFQSGCSPTTLTMDCRQRIGRSNPSVNVISSKYLLLSEI